VDFAATNSWELVVSAKLNEATENWFSLGAGRKVGGMLGNDFGRVNEEEEDEDEAVKVEGRGDGRISSPGFCWSSFNSSSFSGFLFIPFLFLFFFFFLDLYFLIPCLLPYPLPCYWLKQVR